MKITTEVKLDSFALFCNLFFLKTHFILNLQMSQIKESCITCLEKSMPVFTDV